jgi:nitrite reductase/ring-hydroxylating ferredoxin subunit
MTQISSQETFKRGAADAGQFFWYMAEFVGFNETDAATIRETRFIIEKHIPKIVAGFYAQLLRFPATRAPFQKGDGTIDQENLEMRMHHQANFWRRAASGTYDDDFARYVDYVGKAHTAQGADPKIYIAERYVIGMVGFVQQRVAEALAAELRQIDPELEARAAKAWNALLMVILEILARSYGQQTAPENLGARRDIDDEAVLQLAVETYEKSLGIARAIEYKDVRVGHVDEIPEGRRKIIQVADLSIGVFHHKGHWRALHNSCLHRGGPVCTGQLQDDTLTCPWHGYQYDVNDGKLLLDNTAKLPTYPVEVRDGTVYLRIPILIRDEVDIRLNEVVQAPLAFGQPALPPHAFRPADLRPGHITLVHVAGEPVAVYNVDGQFYATHDRCSHVGGPLSEGRLEGSQVICPWHNSCFDVTNGQATCGPATQAVKTYRVTIAGDVGQVLDA